MNIAEWFRANVPPDTFICFALLFIAASAFIPSIIGAVQEWRERRKWRNLPALLFLALIACLPTRAADFTNGTPRLLEVPYGTNDVTPQTIVLVYTNSSTATPITSWPLMTVITNLSVTGTSTIPVNLSLPRMFFVARASNEWGVGDFSTVLLSAPPREDVKLRVR